MKAFCAATLVAIGCSLQAAELATGLIAPGTPAQTTYCLHDSGKPGPTVIVTAGIHGDEPAGCYAAEQMRHWPIRCGQLVIVPQANQPALQAGTRLGKDGTNRLDLNRAFPPKAAETGPEAGIVQALWTLIEAQHPDWLVDLHEGIDFRGQTVQSVGSSVIASAAPEARRLAERIVTVLNACSTIPERRFVLLNSPIKGSLARATADTLHAKTLILETTRKAQPMALRTRQHRVALHALLRELGMLDETAWPEQMLPAAKDTNRLAVAVYDGGGNGGQGLPRVLEQIGTMSNACAARVCPEDIQAGTLKQFRVVIFTGGSGSGQAKALGETGRAEVKRFVEAGGGYIGVCAGAYLACSGFDWSLGLADAKTVSPLWQRGKGSVKVELTEAGQRLFGQRPEAFECLYAQGPIVQSAGRADLADYESLGLFRTEVAHNNTPKGIMVNSPAIFAGRFGQGRVLCFSPHPEQTKGLETMIPRAVLWVSAPAGSP